MALGGASGSVRMYWVHVRKIGVCRASPEVQLGPRVFLTWFHTGHPDIFPRMMGQIF